MKPVAAVTLTWGLAQVLHPLVWIIVEHSISLDVSIGIIIISSALSLPAYLFCLLVYPAIDRWKVHAFWRTAAWLLASQGCILLGSALIIGLDSLVFEMTYPARVAAAVAVLVLAPVLFRKRKAPSIPNDFLTPSIDQ
jgi:hypothetical protein